LTAAFLILLREGIEASLIVAILLAALERMGRRDRFKDVFAGVASALVLVAAGGTAAYLTIRDYAGSRVQTIFEMFTYLAATAILTYMTFWMRSHARHISSELGARAKAALDGRARLGLSLLAFQAVGREGLETVVFMLALVFATSAKGALLGAALGFVASMGVAVAMYHLGKKLNLSLYFKVLGAALMVFAAGLLADAVEDLQQLGWLHILRHPLWDTSHLLSEESSLGDILHSFFGYAARPSVGQVLVYCIYLLASLLAYLVPSLLRRRPRIEPTRAAEVLAAPQPTAGEPVQG
jgi:high-affinity iron transporter